MSVYVWIKGYSICPVCWRFAALTRCELRSVCAGMHLCVCTFVLLDNNGVEYLHLPSSFGGVCTQTVAVIAVARLGNQILFIASRLFQHIRIMINREMEIV